VNELSLFTGAGGGILGTKLLGFRHIGYVEFNDYCQRQIKQRILDGFLDDAPIFSDVRAFVTEGYAAGYQGMVDVLTAGFPCQPFSVAGKQKGAEDERNMWPSTISCIRIIRPRYALLENVPGLLTDPYIQRIFGDLAECGYNAKWCCLGGHETGSITDGERLWIVAFAPDSPMLESLDFSSHIVSCTEESCRRQYSRAVGAMLSQDDYTRIKRNPDDVAAGMDRLKAIGNGQIPRLATTAWRILSQ